MHYPTDVLNVLYLVTTAEMLKTGHYINSATLLSVFFFLFGCFVLRNITLIRKVLRTR
jgi:hypothetical protein